MRRRLLAIFGWRCPICGRHVLNVERHYDEAHGDVDGYDE